MSGKKVKIPINQPADTAGQATVSGTEETVVVASEAASEDSELSDEDGAGESAAADDEGAGGADAALQEQVSRIDMSFLERDVDFSAPEGVDAQEYEQLKRQAAENHDKYIRALADLDNFRKRAQKERADILKYQGEKILCDIVDVLDNLELALQHKDSEPEKLRTGIEMIHKQFVDVLDRWGIRSDSGVGKPFDPNRQNAINKVPAGDAEPGSVIAELKKTYFYKDKLLRVGEVIVADGAGAQPSGGEPRSAENGE